MGTGLFLALVVVQTFGWIVAEDWWKVLLVLGTVLVWGVVSGTLMNVVLGRDNVGAHWNYVTRVYSTFRKD
jgi:hypothetical protein